MQKELLALVLCVSLNTHVFAADNPFEKNYKAQNTGNLVSLEANPDTKMYVSNHRDKDDISMLENGYDMMGTAGFEAGEVPAELALQHGKVIKADTVLVYTKYGSARTAASRMDAIKESAKKNGGMVDEKDIVQDETQYKYFASYWAKLPTPMLGVHIVKLKRTSEDGEPIPENGLKVLAVIKDSPAAKAGLMRGDVLLKVSDIAIDNPEELSAVVRKFQGQNVIIAYEREGESKTTQATINTRNQ